MGAWGTAIASNDTYADVYDEFFDLYNEGLAAEEITKKLISENQSTIDDPDDANNFWFALAKSQWECKALDKEVYDRVRQIVESGNDLEVWRELDADEKDLKKRKIVLDKFLAELGSERTKPKARKKKVIRQPIFEKGDCLAFQLENGNYSGVVVLEAIKDTEYGYNLIASTRINQPKLPTIENFEDAEVLIINYATWKDVANIHRYLPLRNKNIDQIEKIGNIEVKIDYTKDIFSFGGVGAFEHWFMDVANLQFQSEEIKSRPKTRKMIKELIRKKEELEVLVILFRLSALVNFIRSLKSPKF